MNTFIFLIGSMLSVTNTTPTNELKISQPIAVSDIHPSGNAYFTTDQLGNPVLCWTAGEQEKSLLYYSVYNKKSGTFGKSILVTPSKGTSMHGESMNKLAFKNDGTV